MIRQCSNLMIDKKLINNNNKENIKQAKVILLFLIIIIHSVESTKLSADFQGKLKHVIFNP